MKVYAFDVDHTLEVSGGPIHQGHLWDLYHDGHVLGLCGNYALAVASIPDWNRLFSFLGPMGMTKAAFLKQLVDFVPCEEVIMVGNDEEGLSEDGKAAREAGVRFIQEDDFAQGER